VFFSADPGKEPVMATDVSDTAAARKRLWEEIEKRPTGMLGLVGGAPHHFQPMTATLERDEGRLWFFSYMDTDLAQSAIGGHEAMFVLQRNHKFYACVEGDLNVRPDRERVDRYWNPAVAAWYPGGKDDPRLTLLCLELQDAVVWIHEAAPVRFALEMRTSQGASDAGERRSVPEREEASNRPHTAPPGSFAP
jgi:general stress protein 26